MSATPAAGMAEAIALLPEQLRRGSEAGRLASGALALPSAVVIAGMGGSAMGGELLRALVAADCPVPVTRIRAFGIPAWAGPGTLVPVVSYSGDTAEALACARQARAQGAAILAVTSGGRLAALAEEWDVPVAQVPRDLPTGQPRAALGFLFGALAGAFATIGLAPTGLAEECARGAEAADAERFEALGRRLARTTPLVYGTGPLAAVAYRWKTQFNENAKMHAFAHAFPELSHNEIVGWEGARDGRFAAVVLRDPSDHPDALRRLDVAVELIEGDAELVERVDAAGASPAERSFNLVAAGDWASYGAALERGVDPTPVERLVEFKRRFA